MLFDHLSLRTKKELTEKERHATAHKACKPLRTSFADLLTGSLIGQLSAAN